MKEQEQFAIITGTNLKGGKTELLARHYGALLEGRGRKVSYFNLADLPKDFIFTDLWNGPSETLRKVVSEKMEPAHKFIFVIPEYNGSFPGVLKAFIDCLPREVFYGKKAGLMGLSSGHSGALRAMDQFGDVLNYLRVSVLYAKPKLSKIDESFNGDQLINERALSLLEHHCDEMMAF